VQFTDTIILHSDSVLQLNAIAETILQQWPDNRVFLLHGELGAGKTALVQAFCNVLDIAEPVSSPTFSIVQEYEGPDVMVYHFDLYRLDNAADLAQIGFEEYLYQNAYVFIEWPDIAMPLLPDELINIKIEVENNFERRLICSKVNNSNFRQ
jgi:tRNA threonylcarbamoyladenosine biosynthesis protein TsaE